MKILFFLCSLLVFQTASSQTLKIKAKDLKTLAGYLTGEFNNGEQVATDTTFINIFQRMTPVMKTNPEGIWLYLEQATAVAEDKPYRQRVLHLSMANDTTIISKIYEMKNPAQYVGGWKDETKLATITVDSLANRDGCELYIQKVDKEIFRGTTMDRKCPSSLKGAIYSSTQLVIYPDRIVSWERGWDKNDVQVWGSVNGAYAFIKKIKN